MSKKSPSSRVRQALSAWLSGARLAVPIRVKDEADDLIDLKFVGINPALFATLEDGIELNVSVVWQEHHWDFLLVLDVEPMTTADGYVCASCKPEERTVFGDLEALWRDHLFEPFLKWVNEELAAADVIALYGSPSGGTTRAELQRATDQVEEEPAIRISLRVRASDLGVPRER